MQKKIEDELELARCKLAAAQWELVKTQDELARVYESRSWRITAPMRWAVFRLRSYLQATQAQGRISVKLLRQAVNAAKYLLKMDETPLVPVPAIYYEEPRETVPGDAGDVKLIAYYLPQFHTFPENDAWWGKGFTEWTNVRRSRPFFQGHIQPEVPHASIGHYDLGGEETPDILRKQAAMAQRFGIHGFCFHYYWFSGKRLMEKPVDTLLENPDIDLPFCLNWANENWTRRWDGQEQDILIAQQHSPDDDRGVMRDLLRYFNDPRYIRVDGRPLFLVYHAALLPEAKQTLERWRAVCAEHNEADPYFVMVQSFCNFDPRPYGFDAAAQFPPHVHPSHVRVANVDKGFKGRLLSYMQAAAFTMERWTTEYPVFPGVMPSWDNTPRRMENSTVYVGSTPQLYEEWLRRSCDFARSMLPRKKRFVFINSWNEWAEGAQLEPSQEYGFAYLNATARALESFQSSPEESEDSRSRAQE